MSISVSAMVIFLFLCSAAILALTVPLEKQNVYKEECAETDSVLVKLVQVSKNVPAIVDII